MSALGIAARAVLLACVLCLGATQLHGEQQEAGALSATAIPPESWEGVATRLAISLVDPAAGAQEEPLFLPKATARRFGRSEPRPPSTLRDQFSGKAILTVETFEYPGGQVVAGTAVALARQRLEKSIPDGLLRAMTPTPAEAAAAEQTAIRWVTAALSPQKGDRLAILLLWDASAANRPAFERLSFVMIKAGRLPDGRYRVQSLAYGTAQEAVLEGM